MRPRLLIVVTGTGTEVGKTWLGAALARALIEQGFSVSVRKPAQSFAPEDPITDAHVLGLATGESPHDVCPPHRWYPAAMAPPMAASALGRPIPTLGQLTGEIIGSWPHEAVDFGIVEGAGGVASPLAIDGDTASLVRALGADHAIVVAESGLGTINSVRLSLRALDPTPVVAYMNRFDSDNELHRRNRDWLVDQDRVSLATDVARLVRSISGA